MIEEKNIATCIILSIVTCGIYGLYWLVCMVNDLNVVAETPEDTSGGMVLLLSIVTCGIYELYWLYKAGEKLNAAKQKHGLSVDSNSGIIYLILGIFGFAIVSWALIQSELNKMATPNAQV